MKPRIIIVHGIHTTAEGAVWMDYLGDQLFRAGFCSHKFNYGYAAAFTARWRNAARAERLAKFIQPGDVILSHSNGGTLTYMAAKLGAPMGGAIMVNPALDSSRVLASQVPWINLYVNRGDKAVDLSATLIGNLWGDQGRVGLTVADPRYKIIFTDLGTPRIWGHSAILHSKNLAAWTPQIIADLESRMLKPDPIVAPTAGGAEIITPVVQPAPAVDPAKPTTPPASKPSD